MLKESSNNNNKNVFSETSLITKEKMEKYCNGEVSLIKDSVNDDLESLFEDIAINSISYESETLIQLLKSPIFLKPIEEKFNLPKSSLRNMINIKQPKNKYQRNKFADGILDVSIIINNKIKGKEILDELSKAYLNASLERRQQKLNDGLTFLDSQAPKIKLKLDDIQTKLVKFREKYKLIEPSIEVDKIKKQVLLIL